MANTRVKKNNQFAWGASREIVSPIGVGILDEHGNSLPACNRVGVGGVCTFELSKGKKFDEQMRIKVIKAINSALWGMELDDFLYNTKDRNKFINSILKGIKVNEINIDRAFIAREIAVENVPHTKRVLIENGVKVEDVIDECKGFKYAIIKDKKNKL